MNPQQQSSSSGRSSSSHNRRGPRRRSGRPRSDHAPGGERSSSQNGGSPKGQPAKANLWQKIVGFIASKVSKREPARSGVERGPASVHPTLNNGRFTPPGGSTAPAGRPSSTTSRGEENGGGNGSSRAPVRKPEVLEVSTPRLYVGNLSFDATETDLTELFNGVGRVVNAEIISHRQTQRSKGFAFVQMQSVDEAKRAVEQLHDQEFLGRKLFVSGAKNADQHEDRDEPRPAS